MKHIIAILVLAIFFPSIVTAKITTKYTDKGGAATLDMIKNAFNTDNKVYDKLIAPSVTNDSLATVDGSVSFDSQISCKNDAVFAKINLNPNSYGQIQISGTIDENMDGIVDKTISASNVDVFCSNGAIVNCEKGVFNETCKKCLWIYSGSKVSLQCHLVNSQGGQIEVPTSSLQTCTYVSIGSGNTPGALNKAMGKEIALFLTDKARVLLPSISLSKIEFSGSLNQVMTVYAANTASCLSKNEQSKIKQTVDIYNNDPWKLVNPQVHDEEAWELFNSITPDYSGQEKCAINNAVSTKRILAKVSKTAFFYIIWDTDGSSKDCTYGSDSGQCLMSLLYEGKRPKAFWQCRDSVLGIQSRICDDVFGQKYQILGSYGARPAPGYNDPPGSESDIGDKFGGGCNGAHGGDDAPRWQIECEMNDYIDVVFCTSESMGRQGVTLISDTLPAEAREAISGPVSVFTKGAYQACDVVQKPKSSCQELEEDPKCVLISSSNDGIPTVTNQAVKQGYVPTKTCRVVGIATQKLICEDWWSQQRTYKCDLKEGYDPTNLKKRTNTISTGVSTNFTSNQLSKVTDQTFKNGVLSAKSSFPVTVAVDPNNETCQTACVVAKNIHTADLMIKPSEGTWDPNPDEGVPDINNFPVAAAPHSSIYVETRSCEKNGGLVYTCPVNTKEGEYVRYPCSCSESKEFVEVVSLMQMLRNLNDDVTCSSGTKSQTICDATEDPTVPEYGPYICSDYKYTTDGSVDPSTGERYMQKNEIKSCNPTAKSGQAIPNQRFAAFLNDNYECELASANTDGKGLNIKAVLPQYNPVLGAITSQRFWFDWAINYANGYIATGPDSALKPVDDCPCPPSFTTTTVNKPDGTYTCNYSKLPSSGIAVDYAGVKMNPESDMPFGSVKISADASAKYSYTHKGICTRASSQCHVLGWLGCPVEMASGPRPICHGWDGDPKYCNYYTCNITGKHYMFNDDCEDECVVNAECGVSKVTQVFTAGIVRKGTGDLWGKILNENATVEKEFDIFVEKDILGSCVDKFNVNTINYADALTGFVYKYTAGDYHIFANAAARGDQPYNKEENAKVELPLVPPVYNGGSQNIPARPMYKNKTITTSYEQKNYGMLGALYLSIAPNTPTINYYQCPVGRTVKGSALSACGANAANKPGLPFSGIFPTIDGSYCYENTCSPATMLEGEMSYPGCGFVNDGAMKYE